MFRWRRWRRSLCFFFNRSLLLRSRIITALRSIRLTCLLFIICCHTLSFYSFWVLLTNILFFFCWLILYSFLFFKSRFLFFSMRFIWSFFISTFLFSIFNSLFI